MIPTNFSLLEVVEAFGFENWRDSRIAEELIDAGESPQFLDGNMYLLEGCCPGYESIFFHVYITWERGKQPRVKRIERELM